MIKIDEIELELLTVLQPDDRILFRVSQKLSVGEFSVLREQIADRLGPIRFLIISPGIEAYVLRQLNRDDSGDMRAKRRRENEGSGGIDGTAGEVDQAGRPTRDQDQDNGARTP